MFPQGHKYFRLCFGSVLAFVFVQAHQVSVPKGCVEVASYAIKTDRKETNLANDKLMKNSFRCIQELYKIWREARNMPKGIRDLVCKASNLGKNASSIAEVALYLLCRTLDLYDRTMQLDIDFKTYRKEYELLQAELHQVTELIDKELMPLWEHLDSATLHMIRSKQSRKLRGLHEALRQLAQVIYKDLIEARNSMCWAFVYVAVSTAVCAVSIFSGNVPGGIACAAAVVVSGISAVFLTTTVLKLTSLLDDITIMANEIEEYRILLEQKPILGISFGIFNSFLFLSVILWLFYKREAQASDQ